MLLLNTPEKMIFVDMLAPLFISILEQLVLKPPRFGRHCGDSGSVVKWEGVGGGMGVLCIWGCRIIFCTP